MVQSYSFNIYSHFIFLSSLLVNLGQSVDPWMLRSWSYKFLIRPILFLLPALNLALSTATDVAVLLFVKICEPTVGCYMRIYVMLLVNSDSV